MPGIVAFGEAARLLREKRPQLIRELHSWKSILLKELSGIDRLIINSPLDITADTVLHFSVRSGETEGLLLRLSMAGVMASMGSACNTETVEPSHVVTAAGIEPEYARGCIRLSLGKGFTEEMARELGKTVRRICAP